MATCTVDEELTDEEVGGESGERIVLEERHAVPGGLQCGAAWRFERHVLIVKHTAAHVQRARRVDARQARFGRELQRHAVSGVPKAGPLSPQA